MKTTTKISRRLEHITQERLLDYRRVLNLKTSCTATWRGTKRYAH